MNMAARFPTHPEETEPQNEIMTRVLSRRGATQALRPEKVAPPSEPDTMAEPHWPGHWAVTLYL